MGKNRLGNATSGMIEWFCIEGIRDPAPLGIAYLKEGCRQRSTQSREHTTSKRKWNKDDELFRIDAANSAIDNLLNQHVIVSVSRGSDSVGDCEHKVIVLLILVHNVL